MVFFFVWKVVLELCSALTVGSGLTLVVGIAVWSPINELAHDAPVSFHLLACRAAKVLDSFLRPRVSEVLRELLKHVFELFDLVLRKGSSTSMKVVWVLMAILISLYSSLSHCFWSSLFLFLRVLILRSHSSKRFFCCWAFFLPRPAMNLS